MTAMFLQRMLRMLPLMASFWVVASPVLAFTTEAEGTFNELPQGVQIGPDGFATILEAPPVPYRDEPPPSDPNQIWRDPESALAAEIAANPDEDAHQAAVALNDQLSAEEAGNYVGVRVVRDPTPRFAFYFRNDAVATLARYTDDERFIAVEGGVPVAELQPLYNDWAPRFAAHRIGGGGHIDAFEGMVVLELSVDDESFRAVAEAEEWELPQRLRLIFASPPIENPVDPAIEPLIRLFPREDRVRGSVLTAGLSGRIILRDGCFRLAGPDPTQDGDLVIFERDDQLVVDEEGYLAIKSRRDDEPHARIGELMTWAGPRGVDEFDTGLHALREACGDDPVVSLGAPSSAHHFRVRPWIIDNYARNQNLSRQEAWDALKGCWAQADALHSSRERMLASYQCEAPAAVPGPPALQD